jgi:hypothetical protein
VHVLDVFFAQALEGGAVRIGVELEELLKGHCCN